MTVFRAGAGSEVDALSRVLALFILGDFQVGEGKEVFHTKKLRVRVIGGEMFF